MSLIANYRTAQGTESLPCPVWCAGIHEDYPGGDRMHQSEHVRCAAGPAGGIQVFIEAVLSPAAGRGYGPVIHIDGPRDDDYLLADLYAADAQRLATGLRAAARVIATPGSSA